MKTKLLFLLFSLIFSLSCTDRSGYQEDIVRHWALKYYTTSLGLYYPIAPESGQSWHLSISSDGTFVSKQVELGDVPVGEGWYTLKKSKFTLFSDDVLVENQTEDKKYRVEYTVVKLDEQEFVIKYKLPGYNGDLVLFTFYFIPRTL